MMTWTAFFMAFSLPRVAGPGTMRPSDFLWHNDSARATSIPIAFLYTKSPFHFMLAFVTI